MKKIIIALLIVSLLAMTACAKQTDSPEEVTMDKSNIEEVAVSLANDIVGEKYQQAYDDYIFSDEMKEAVSPEFFKNDIGTVQSKYGSFSQMKTPIITQTDGYTIVSIPMVFENSKVNYNIVFNEKSEIAGFNIGNYQESEGETIEETDIIEISIEEEAYNYAKDLMEGNYEKAYTEYAHDATMTQAVSAEVYQTMIEGLKESNGDFVKIGEIFTLDVDIYTAANVPVEMTKENLSLEIYFDAENQIAGLKFIPYQEKTETVMPDNIIEQDLTAKVNGVELGGTLTLPKEGENFPCVVLVHGSGPNDRDETILSNKPFRDIAWELAKSGIAVYRYDKRSNVYPDEFRTGYDLTIYDETVDDAIEIAKMLQSIDSINADKIYILGHSLGGYAMPRIAQNTKFAAGYIIMAGSARAPHELIPIQYEYLLGLDGDISDEDRKTLDALAAEAQKILNIDDYEETEAFMGMYKTYIQDLLSYDPIETATSIDAPVLVLQGERDYQVTMIDYNMWLNAFGDNDSWSFKLYPKLNHLMMPGEGAPNNVEYSIISNVDEKVIEDLVDFITR